MNPDKIAKLRELADRGIGGEKTNARDILTKAGVDWRKPKESIKDTIKKTFGVNITKEYAISIEKSTDMLLIQKLLAMFIKDDKDTVHIKIGQNKIYFNATPAEMEDIKNCFFKQRDSFSRSMSNEADKYIKGYMNI